MLPLDTHQSIQSVFRTDGRNSHSESNGSELPPTSQKWGLG